MFLIFNKNKFRGKFNEKNFIRSFIISFILALTGCSASKEEKVERVFVYGSLRSDMFNYKTHLEGKVKENVKGTIEGDLFHIENKEYPAVVPGDGEVVGELMTFNDFESTLKDLDELEAYEEGKENENEYNRKIVNVKISEGTVIKAYYYEYNPPAD